jgi:hypothetical protein
VKERHYCIDANVVIQGRKFRYPPKHFPGLWGNIEHLIAMGRMHAPEMVKHELEVAEDEIRDWIKRQRRLFVSLNKAQTDEVTRIQEDFDNLVDHRKGKSGADPFVVALAKVGGYTVVTLENKSGRGERPRIPNVCDRYGINCVDLIGLMGLEGWTF